MPARIFLEVVSPEEGHDSIIAAAKPGFPLLKGVDHQHLACGACRDVLAWNISARTMAEMFIVVHRLILQCRCGAHNLVPDEARRARPRLTPSSRAA